MIFTLALNTHKFNKYLKFSRNVFRNKMNMTFYRIKCNATWRSWPLTNSFPRIRQSVLSDCNSSFPRFTQYNTRERIERIAIRENRLSNSRERITKPWNELLIRENGLHNSIYNDLLMALFLKIFIFRTSVLRPVRKKIRL